MFRESCFYNSEILHNFKRLGIFLFTTVSRTALGPIQWVAGALSLSVKRQNVKL